MSLKTAENTYDANGNMKTDTNKSITGISYNHLNLPTTVNIGGGTITYMYDATGVKQKKIVSTGTTTDYAGNYVYENNTLQFFNHPEGYVQHKNGIFSYVYQYKDHLGNVRLSYADINGNYQTILDDNFSDSLGGWLENGTVNYSLDAGRLKANVKTSWEGVKHYLNGFTTTAGEVLKVKITFDKGNTQSNVRLYLHEVDPSGNLVAYNVKTGNLQTGTYEYSHTMANTGNSIIFRIDKDNTNTSTETYFYIDHVSLTQNDLEIIEESNYYPFGLQHKGYNNTISSNGNSTAEKFKYQGQELEEELGKDTYAFQWRDYDPAIARFNKIDRFAEKYMKNSPYSFTANNPIYFREIAGDSIDVSRALAQDRKALTKVVKDLQTKTGLTFTLKKGKLVYKKDADGNAVVSKDADGNSIGSESARNLVTGALDNSKTVNLSFGKLENGNVGVAGTSSVDGMEHIVLDPSNIDKMISGSSKGLNNTTFGFAMSFMHEIDHTSIGVSKTGHGAESTTFGLTGTVVDNMNKIRRELGSSYGQRTSYSAMKTFSGNFIPFSTSSLSTLKSNPTPGILSILSNGNSKALNKIYLSIKF